MTDDEMVKAMARAYESAAEQGTQISFHGKIRAALSAVKSEISQREEDAFDRGRLSALRMLDCT